MEAELDEIRRLADLPLLLDSEMEEKVFSHKSVFGNRVRMHVEREEPQDYERFAFLGDQVLSFIATEVVFERYPFARPSFLTEKRALVTKNEEIAKWSSAYGLPQRIKAHPSQQAVIQFSTIAKASVFEAYIGAVFDESGIDLVGAWVKPLIRRVLNLDDIAQMTPRGELSPLSRRGDSDAGIDEMSEEILLHRFDSMSVAESTSTAVGANSGGYNLSMNQFRTRSIAPSSHDGSLNYPDTPSTGFYDAADRQPIPLATGKPSPLKHEIRDYQPGHYSPGFPGHHSPSQLPSASSSQYTSDTIPNVPSYSHQQSQQSPPFASGYESHRSSSSNTVRPPVKSPRSSPNTSTNTNSQSSQPSPKFMSPSNSDSSSSAQSQTSTQSVTGGHLALFNQMATQKQERVEWKISSSGPPHRPRFDAQVFIRNYCYGRGQALTKKQAQQSAAEAALRSLGWIALASTRWPEARTSFWTRTDVRAWQHKQSRIFVAERQIQSLFRTLFLRKK